MSEHLHLDCDDCGVRPHACGDCVVSFLFGGPPEADGRAALAVLADSGLVPPLQHTPETPGRHLRVVAEGDAPGTDQRPQSA